MSKSTHIPALDGLRAISILAVIGHHAYIPCARGGFLGVDVFFVLSGFLITSLLVREWDSNCTISIKRFYFRRALRLLPALGLLLACCGIFAALFRPPESAHQTYEGIAYAMSYVGNWKIVVSGNMMALGPLSHTWSLSIEEQFYLLWPLALLFMLRMRFSRRVIATFVVSGIVACAVWRGYLWHQHHDWGRLYYGSDTHADGLLIGCLLGLDVLPMPSPKLFKALGLLSTIIILSLFVGASYKEGYVYYAGVSLINIATGCVLLFALHTPPKILEWNPAVWIGKRSYGIYLWHVPIIIASHAQGWVARGAIGLTVPIIVAGLSYRFVEKPFLRYKSRFEPCEEKSVTRSEQHIDVELNLGA